MGDSEFTPRFALSPDAAPAVGILDVLDFGNESELKFTPLYLYTREPIHRSVHHADSNYFSRETKIKLDRYGM